METTLTFEQLPKAVSQLVEKMENIERLLLGRDNHTPTTNSDQLLTIKQASEFLSLAVPTLYSMVSKNELPYMKRSKRLYFSREELINYLKEGRHKSIVEINNEAREYISKRKNSPHNGK